MRIYDRNLAGSAGPEAGRTADTQRPGGAGGSSSSHGKGSGIDRVEFSQAVGALSRALGKESSGHAAKIEALRTSYERGTYRPAAGAISRAMVSDALDGSAG